MIGELLSVWFLVKILFIAAFGVYIAFAVIAVRQVYLMTQTLSLGFESVLRTLAWAHLLFALTVLLFAFVLL